jgi:hypothetical protein
MFTDWKIKHEQPPDANLHCIIWADKETGLICAALRQKLLGNWNGYVGVMKDSFLYGMDYTSIDNETNVHGGLTFAGRMEPVTCFGDYWCFGFDTAHFHDYVPGLGVPPSSERTYKSIDFILLECADLAKQLKALEAKGRSNAKRLELR